MTEVTYTAEFRRVTALPRRVWAADDLDTLARELTAILRTPQGTMSLRPVQALALHDAGTERGLFGAVGVGEGKTIISLLMPVVLGAQRPILLLPGGLIEKTQRARRELSVHWRIPTSLRIMSYDILGRVSAAEELNTYQPDAIICDEVHRLKNRRAAVTRRVARYMHDYPLTAFCGMSGSVMDKSLTDFAHLLLWALKTKAPIPTSREEIEEWAEALDHGVDPLARRRPGALLAWAEDGQEDVYVRARHGFRRRLTETPGVVATVGEGEHVSCSIYVRGIRHAVSAVTEANFLKLRSEWATPDDWQLMTGADVWRHAREMALGLYYIWSPRPPDDWREARRAWNAFVRETISHSRTYDSELHVANACDQGRLDPAALNAWRRIKPTFVPNVVPVWCDDTALDVCAEWLGKSPGLVWTEHRFFAERLAERTGIPYYGAGGFSADGRYIEDAKAGDSAIASIDANREGKNLQTIWHRNLMVCPPSSATWWEQTIARTHRPGQTADEVIVDVLLCCREDWDACQDALAAALAVQDTTGKSQKILLADVTLPTEEEIHAIRSPRWQR